MGWASGGQLLRDIFNGMIDEGIGAPSLDVCLVLLRAFEDSDFDVHVEVFDERWPNFEAACYVLHPEWNEDS